MRKYIGLSITTLGAIITFLFLALEIRHHHYWLFYENETVKRLEGLMGIGQTPENANFHKRSWIKRGLFGIRATSATILIYIFSLVFFAIAFLIFLFHGQINGAA